MKTILYIYSKNSVFFLKEDEYHNEIKNLSHKEKIEFFVTIVSVILLHGKYNF